MKSCLPLLLCTVAALSTQRVAAAAPSGAAEGPCDILAAAGNPCGAAHSTVRALFAHYAGPLYKVTRPSAGNVSANISVLKPGGFADIAAHEKFCADGDCVISNIFDQSPNLNHLYQRISDGVVHKMVNASKHKIAVAGGLEVFGMWFDKGHGYRTQKLLPLPPPMRPPRPPLPFLFCWTRLKGAGWWTPSQILTTPRASRRGMIQVAT
jgi:hypothetical protein